MSIHSKEAWSSKSLGLGKEYQLPLLTGMEHDGLLRPVSTAFGDTVTDLLLLLLLLLFPDSCFLPYANVSNQNTQHCFEGFH